MIMNEPGRSWTLYPSPSTYDITPQHITPLFFAITHYKDLYSPLSGNVLVRDQICVVYCHRVREFKSVRKTGWGRRLDWSDVMILILYILSLSSRVLSTSFTSTLSTFRTLYYFLLQIGCGSSRSRTVYETTTSDQEILLPYSILLGRCMIPIPMLTTS